MSVRVTLGQPHFRAVYFFLGNRLLHIRTCNSLCAVLFASAATMPDLGACLLDTAAVSTTKILIVCHSPVLGDTDSGVTEFMVP